MARITENQWVSYHGFQRFPFDRPEAGNEEFARPDFLSACFVPPSNYGRILGQADAPVTALLFAARGAGKTACRVMADYNYREGLLPRGRDATAEKPPYVLSVPHIHLDQVLNRARQSPALGDTPVVTAEHHAEEILKRAVPALADLVARATELREAAANLSPFQKLDLGWFLETYSHYLSVSQTAFLHELVGVDSPVRERPVWVDGVLRNRAQASPLDHLTQWTTLVHQMGVQATFVSIDGVDEFQESAGDPDAAYALVRPLLTSLRLMDGTPYCALKFFLPDSLEPLIMGDPAFRKERGFVIERIHWSEQNLIEILRKRLAALKVDANENRDRTEVSFDVLCVPDIRGQIEHDLAQWAKNNPRRMMILCGLMVEAHCVEEITGQDDPYQLNRADWYVALETFERRVGRPAPVAEEALPLADLIAQGENERVEFKSSIRWDFTLKAANKGLQMSIARAICGMLNSKGGILIVGVDDDRSVIGIESDLKALEKPNRDGFELYLTNIIKHHLGIAYRDYVQVGFETVQDREVCVLAIDPCPEPVFLKTGNENEFCVRRGNATHKLDAKETVQYIQAHWGKRE